MKTIPRGRSVNLDKPCPRCGGSVSKGWVWADGRACPTCGVHLKPSPNLKSIYVISIILGLILGLIIVRILGLLDEEWNIRLPGGSFNSILARSLAIIGIFLYLFKKYVTMLVDDANAGEAKSNTRSENEKDIDR